MYECDSTGAVVTFNCPSNPPNGTSFLVKNVGATVAVPTKINAGGTDIIENPGGSAGGPGTFSGAGGQVVMRNAGQIAAWKFASGRWIEFI